MLKNLKRDSDEVKNGDFKQLSFLMKKAVGYNTISEFANKCGIPNSARTIADICHGKVSMFPELGFLRKIALSSEFRVSLDELKLACGYNLDEKEIDLRKIKVRRGWICNCDYGKVLDSEMGGIRPSLVISNNVGNDHASILLVIPISSRISKNKMCTHIRIGTKHGLARESELLIEQMRTVSKRRLMIDGFIQPICECSPQILREVEIAIMKQTAIVHPRLNESIVYKFLDKLDEYSERVENGFSNNYNNNYAVSQQQYQPQPVYV